MQITGDTGDTTLTKGDKMDDDELLHTADRYLTMTYKLLRSSPATTTTDTRINLARLLFEIEKEAHDAGK